MFSERLRQARRAAGLSQAELAGDRCTLGYVSHLERGRREPTPELVAYFEQRLGLRPGELTGAAEPGTPAGDGVAAVQSARAMASYLRAKAFAQDGAFVSAKETIEPALSTLEPGADVQLEWLLRELLAQVEADLGRFEVACACAQQLAGAHLNDPDGELAARASIMVAQYARLCGRFELAQSFAAEALRLTSGENVALRVEALTAMLALYPDGSAPYLQELTSLIGEMPREHMTGVAAWVLGNYCLNGGQVAQGLEWHAMAQELLSPAADIRRWARFPRTSAVVRMRAGTTAGVEELLELAHHRIAVLESPNETASLVAADAEYAAARGHHREAWTMLDEALSTEGLSPRTIADLHFAYARTADGQDPARRRDHALEAARLYTKAEALRDAQRAWELTDE